MSPLAGLTSLLSLVAAQDVDPDRALLDELRDVPQAELQTTLVRAFERFQALTDAFRLDRALPLAEAMYARAPAGWSAANLARVLTRAGRHAEARALLTRQLEWPGTDAATLVALRDDRALAALAARDERAGRLDLGHAFSRGSPNAGVVLGQRALAAGRTERARAVFRSLLKADPPQAWALRGWGLGMVRSPGP